MNITLDRDFARIYCGKYLLCVKDVVFSVRRVHRHGSGSGSAIVSDVDVVIEDDNTLHTFTDIEENIRECFDNDETIRYRFPDLEGRMLMNKISKNKMIVTRLRFLDSKPASVSQMLVNLKSEDRVRANIALMGIKHIRGDVFPVWRVISGSIVLEPDGVASSEDEWPGEIVNGEEDCKETQSECVNASAQDHHLVETLTLDDNNIAHRGSLEDHDNDHHYDHDNDHHYDNNDLAHDDAREIQPPAAIEVASEYVVDGDRIDTNSIIAPSSSSSKPSKSKVKLASRDREMIISTLRSELKRDFDNWCSQR